MSYFVIGNTHQQILRSEHIEIYRNLGWQEHPADGDRVLVHNFTKPDLAQLHYTTREFQNAPTQPFLGFNPRGKAANTILLHKFVTRGSLELNYIVNGKQGISLWVYHPDASALGPLAIRTTGRGTAGLVRSGIRGGGTKYGWFAIKHNGWYPVIELVAEAD